MFPDSLHLKSDEYKEVAKPSLSKGFQGVKYPVLKLEKTSGKFEKKVHRGTVWLS